jgi:hypothetical protein
MDVFQDPDAIGKCGDITIRFLPGGQQNNSVVPLDCCMHPKSEDYVYTDGGPGREIWDTSDLNIITPFTCIKVDSKNRNDYKATAINDLKIKANWCQLSL